MRVGLLECDHVGERYRGIDGDYSDMFETLLGRELVHYDAVNGELPTRPDECDAWLATTVLPLHFQNEIAISAQALLRVGIHGRPPGFTFVGAQQETQLPRRFGRNALGISR